MLNDLPEDFDLLVVGTGFVESCLAAAASRIGKTVLHVDPNAYYGGPWASFGLHRFVEFLDTGGNEEVRNVSYTWHDLVDQPPSNADAIGEQQLLEMGNGAQATAASNSTPTWTKTRIMEKARRFNLDLCPKVCYASGSFVRLLITSNICRYTEFRSIDHVCTRYQNEILDVPCSRSDVFNSKDLSIIEKRLLMKFLGNCVSYMDGEAPDLLVAYQDKTFKEFLQRQRVTEKVATCVMQAIAMCTDATPFVEGMERATVFLTSLGRYGTSPFLFPMYGSGEMPQCICRMSAVFGGVYCLNCRVGEMTIDADTQMAAAMVEGRIVRAKRVVCSHGNVPQNLRRIVGISGYGDLVNCLSRAVFLAETPLGDARLNSGRGGVNLLRLTIGEREAILLQLSYFTGVCPEGLYVFHLTTPALSNDPSADLEPFMQQIFSGANVPKFLFSAYFTLTACAPSTQPIDASTPIVCTAAPYYELDYEHSIRNALEIFRKLYGPDVEFLPRAPDPEEILIDGEDPMAISVVNLPDDLRAQLDALNGGMAAMDLTDASQMQDNQH